MDSSRNDTCSVAHPHPNCAACGVAILRRSEHTHVYEKGGLMRDAICHECWMLICAASTAVLQAMEAIGVAPTFRELDALLRSSRVAVLVQGVLVDAP